MKRYEIDDTDYNKLVRHYGRENKILTTVGPLRRISRGSENVWRRVVSEKIWFVIQSMLRVLNKLPRSEQNKLASSKPKKAKQKKRRC
ncbi:MAG: hypothetical protein A2534_01445 [Candidatus Magasanikbacteria bacterium RIFOXYD2_FULL_39_9]|uniref:Uncharacterized protein n=1 Tax=Candidatus Magasanikbacteria bacterium RIFOXYD1_FULL_40_23 TaxID=1798705 RepID=A0A1F6P8S4_9BACT|nr:MAG: hypothetical protein A2534_01445 [Candidatus Magasanikbacteria bacterium RIFOXYD2_FULL_39_9]OGH92552.1 MAG: hypothetical protein A2563_02640 [Candidatus Magasanikbacteria bacterium RIFOXYD1_FULL_40_23]